MALAIITGLYGSQHYWSDATATQYIQQHATPYVYDVGGWVPFSQASSFGAKINAALEGHIGWTSVNVTLIGLPHVNFSWDPLATEADLLGSTNQSDLAPAFLLWVNASVFSAQFAAEFNMTTPVQPGVYLQRSIGQVFGLPANNPFNFSFGAFNASLNVAPDSTTTNFTAIAQNVHCRGYFDLVPNALSDFQQHISSITFFQQSSQLKYFILCVGDDNDAADPAGLPLPPYFIGLQETVFLVKVTGAGAVNVENLPQEIQLMSTISEIFSNSGIGTYGDSLLFDHVDQYNVFWDTITQAGGTSALGSTSFFIISCIFFYWFFSTVADSRLAPLVQDITYGVPRKRVLGSFLLVEGTLAIAGAACANSLGMILGFVTFIATGGSGPFFLSLTLAGGYLVQLVVINVIVVGIFSFPFAIKLLRRDPVFTHTRFRKGHGIEFRVKIWQVLGCAGIFLLVGVSLVPPSSVKPQDFLFPLVSFIGGLNPILSPAMTLLLALGGMWLLTIAIAKFRAKLQNREQIMQRVVEWHIQGHIAPPRRTFTFLLLVGITSVTLIASFSAIDSRQVRYAEETLGWVGGSFKISNDFLNSNFQSIYGDILQSAQVAGFQGEYDVIFSTLVTVTGFQSSQWTLRFVDPGYFASLAQLADDFFADPHSKSATLDGLQENCTVLPISYRDQFHIALNDTITVQAVQFAPFNGTGIQVPLRVSGFYYAFPGVRTDSFSPEPIVCSNQTLKYFQGEVVATGILFNSAGGNVSRVTSALNATYGTATYLATYDDQLTQVQSSDSLSFSQAKNYCLVLAILLYGEFSIAFATILLDGKGLITMQRVRGETLAECGTRYIHSYGTLLLVGLVSSIVLGLLGAYLSTLQLNTNFFTSVTGVSVYSQFPYYLVFPWGEFGVLSVLLLANWVLIQAWFLIRAKKLNFNVELKQVTK